VTGSVEQPRASAEGERHDVQPQLVDQAGGEVLDDAADISAGLTVLNRRTPTAATGDDTARPPGFRQWHL
jgi:hypothetical protein